MKRLYKSFILASLLPLPSMADVWQDPVTKVNYEYTVGVKEAQVKAGEMNRNLSTAGSAVSGDITILQTFTVDGEEHDVTSIGERAFYGRTGLTSITIPESIATIGGDAFLDCNGLSAVHVNSLKAWCCTEFRNIFSNPLYYAKHLFLNGEEVREVDIPSDRTCVGAYTFSGCTSLLTAKIPKGVTTIGKDAFYGCTHLSSINLPEGVINIGEDAFEDCISLTGIILPAGVTTIGFGAFSGCTGLTSLFIPKSLTTIGTYAFFGCSSLTSISVEEGNVAYDSRSDCNAIIETASGILLTGCANTVIPSSVTTIGSAAFWDCSGLKNISIPQSVTFIDEYAFAYSGLANIVIPKNVVAIGDNAFEGCDNLIMTKQKSLNAQ